MHTMNSTEPDRVRRFPMNEKAYTTMKQVGAANIVIGIVAVLTGVVCGILLIVHGGRLLKNKSELTF